MCVCVCLCLQIIPGGDIPEEYYLANLMETCREEMERVVVGRGSSRLLTYRVDTPGTVLRYVRIYVIQYCIHCTYILY